jgi:hypothetical protein
MPFNQPGNNIDNSENHNLINKSINQNLVETQKSIFKYIEKLDILINGIQSNRESYTPEAKSVDSNEIKEKLRFDKAKTVEVLKNSFLKLKAFPYIAESLMPVLDEQCNESNIYRLGDLDDINEVLETIENALPSNGQEEIDYNGENVIRSTTKSFGPAGIQIINLKVIGPKTTSLIKAGNVESVNKVGNGQIQKINAAKDKIGRKKFVSFDSIMSSSEDLSHIYSRDLDSFNLHKNRVEQIIHDCDQAFTVLTGRLMDKNEIELLQNNLNSYLNSINKDETENRLRIMSTRGDFRGVSGDDQLSFIKNSKIEELVALKTICVEFLQNNLSEELRHIQNNTKTRSDGFGSSSFPKFKDKKEGITEIKSLYSGIDKLQDYLIEISDNSYLNNFITNRPITNNFQSNQYKTNLQKKEFTNESVNKSSSNDYIDVEIVENPSNVESEVPIFNTKRIEMNVESVETTSQFVNKYFKGFDAFLITSVDRAKINNEEVLKFTGEGHNGGEINKNSYVKVPITGLSKFELQTLGKIAEKYNTVEGVQIWMGNEQIGFLDKNGQMLELLQ